MTRHDHAGGTGSTVAIGEHPIRPMLVTFPIALSFGALAADFTFATTSDAFGREPRSCS